MRVAVTGATGHLGPHVLEGLLREGHRPRVLVLDGARRPELLESADIEVLPGDVLDESTLQRAFEGIEVVFHLAAVISLAGDPSGIVRAVNVNGVRNAARAALEAGVRRFVHVSSIHAFDLRRGSGAIDERSPRAGADHPEYDRSKRDGESELRRVMDDGLEAVILNPTGFIGPGDLGPSYMGQVLLALYHRRMPASVAGGFNWIDVRDVASAVVAAASRGTPGANYLLSGHWRSVRQLAVLAGETTGVKPPWFTTPLWLARASLPLAPLFQRWIPPGLFTAESLAPLTLDRPISNSLARQDLGFDPRSIEETIADSYTWFRAQGYLEPGTMTELEVHAWLVRLVFGLGLASFLFLLFVVAPYGRHTRSGWGPTVDFRFGWIWMESPAVIGFAAIYSVGELATRPVPLLLVALWMLHYVERGLVYPFRVRSGARRIPVLVALSGFSFNCLNAYINARWISQLGPYSERSFLEPWLLTGVGLFLFGRWLNRRSDRTLIALRKPGEEGYRIPHGGAFRWVSCPNYLGEIIEWLGWAVAARSMAGLAFAFYTASNLVPRALSHHRWYREQFADYPAERRAVIPFLL